VEANMHVRTRHVITRDTAARVMKAMLEVFPEFVPEHYIYEESGRCRQMDFDPARIDEMMRSWNVRENESVSLWIDSLEEWDATIHVDQILDYHPVVYRVPPEAVQRDPSIPRRMVDLALRVYEMTSAYLGYVHDLDHYSDLVGFKVYDPSRDPEPPHDTRWGQSYGIPGTVAWANLWGPEVVEKVGRERIERVDWHEMRRLADGGYLLMLSSDPFDYGRPEAEAKRQRAIKALRLEELREKQEKLLAKWRKAHGITEEKLVYRVHPGKEVGEFEFELISPSEERLKEMMESTPEDWRNPTLCGEEDDSGDDDKGE